MGITQGANAIGVKHAGRWSRVTTLSLANGGTTTIPWTVETEDTDNFLTPTSDTITIPAGLSGLYLLHASIICAAIMTSRGRMEFNIAAGSSSLPASTPGAVRANMVSESDNSVTALVQLNAGNTVTVSVFHSTGSAVTMNSAALSLVLIPAGGGPIGLTGATGPTGPAGTNAVVILTDATQSISSATYTDITWGTEVSDVDGWTSGGSATLTVPAGKGGLYVVSYVGQWATSSLGTTPGMDCVINGLSIAASNGPTAFGGHALCFARTLAAGDTIYFRTYQNSGGAVTLSSRLEITPVTGPGATGPTGATGPAAGLTTGRNLFDNGAMAVCQRATSVAGIASVPGVRTVDRWFTQAGALGVHTQSQEASGPTDTEFKNSLKVLCTTADASPAAGDYLLIGQGMEGQFLQHLLWGTASAKSVTLTFWVRANITGTFVAEFIRAEATVRYISVAYTVAAANTWEFKTITIPGDQTTLVTNDTADRFRVNWWLGSGTTYNSGTLQTSWANSVSANRNVGGTNLMATVNNFIEFAGAQIEVGAVATAYDTRPYDAELRRCYRYLLMPGKITNDFSRHRAHYYSTNFADFFVPTPVTMRAAPTMVGTGGTDWRVFSANGGGGTTYSSTNTPVLSPNGVSVTVNHSTGAVDGTLAFGTNGGFSAEI